VSFRPEHEEIAKALKARLSELRTHLAEVDRELHKPLSADSEDHAIELENQEALEVIKKTETTEIHQIEAALKRFSEGTYGAASAPNGLLIPQPRTTFSTRNAAGYLWPAAMNLQKGCRGLPCSDIQRVGVNSFAKTRPVPNCLDRHMRQWPP
jgi:RNA polymerase-binding transcription factor DksA